MFCLRWANHARRRFHNPPKTVESTIRPGPGTLILQATPARAARCARGTGRGVPRRGLTWEHSLSGTEPLRTFTTAIYRRWSGAGPQSLAMAYWFR
jgi:hypothetical protein